MPAFTLDEVREATGAKLYKMEHEEFTDIVTDTRKITPGVLFLAFKGERFNGEDFVRDAVEKGASGVMVSTGCPKEQLAGLKTTVLIVPDTLAAYQQLAHAWRMRFSLPVVAITGSNGKTTTKDLTAAVLSARGPVLKTQANYNNEIGLPLTLLGLRKEHTAAVVEIGMRGLHQIEAMAPIAAPSVGHPRGRHGHPQCGQSVRRGDALEGEGGRARPDVRHRERGRRARQGYRNGRRP